MQTLERPMLLVADSAQELYLETLNALQSGEEVASVCDPNSVGSGWGNRDRPTRELRHVSLVLQNPRHRLILAPHIRWAPLIARAVLATLSDEKDVEALAFYDPRAKEFSDDGSQVLTNYGYRIRNFDAINQMQQVIDQFRRDRNTRRAVIHIHTARDADCKYDPCIDSLHFLIRNEQLECRAHWRSENALTLLPVNLFEFTLLQELIASELEISPGPYIHTVTSLHYYLEDEAKVHKALMASSEFAPAMEPMPAYSIRQVDLIREFERTWRLDPSSIEEKGVQGKMSEYWSTFANAIAQLIARKSGYLQVAEVLAESSPWRGLLGGERTI